VKTREITTQHKVFINLCKSDDVPEPDDYFTDDQIAHILANGSDDEVSDIRLPMSIGEKHIEKDKSKCGRVMTYEQTRCAHTFFRYHKPWLFIYFWINDLKQLEVLVLCSML